MVSQNDLFLKYISIKSWLEWIFAKLVLQNGKLGVMCVVTSQGSQGPLPYFSVWV